MLNHWWLKMIPHYDTKMSRNERREVKKVYKIGPLEDESES